MSVNELMHPRNKYHQKPNFQELIQQFPELNQVATVGLNGKLKLDYKNNQSVQLLSKCLLLRDFGLKLNLPPNKLVPTLPLRLNYIHWLEDIGSTLGWQEKESTRGIDIGCGASCIYPLLAVVQSNFRWHMIAIEKAEDSLLSAKSNVILNGLQTFIDVRSQAPSGNSILSEVLENFPNEHFDFCMCNPPFYDSASVCKPQNRTGKRREPSNASSGSGEELCTEGGEVKFISQIIQESLQLKDRISVYTTMMGHKKSYVEILKRLESTSIHNITVTRFCQGNTTRWAVAWSFGARVLPTSAVVKHVHESNSSRQKKSLNKAREWRIFAGQEVCSIETVKQYLVTTLRSIQLKVLTLSEKTDEVICELLAQQNTWSHQRRKRRSEQLPQRTREEQPANVNSEEKRQKLEDLNRNAECLSGRPYLRAAMNIHRKDKDYFLALEYIEGIASKDSVNQILQFIKNKVKTKSITQFRLEENKP